MDNVEYADYREEIERYANSIRQKIDEELKRIEDETLRSLVNGTNFEEMFQHLDSMLSGKNMHSEY